MNLEVIVIGYFIFAGCHFIVYFSKKNKNSFTTKKCNERYVVYILPASNVTGMDNKFF